MRKRAVFFSMFFFLSAVFAIGEFTHGAQAEPASSQPENCTGALTINGDSTPLRHAYAVAEQSSIDKTKEDITVILTDAPLSPWAVMNFPERVIPSSQGKLRSVELTIGPENKIDSVIVLYSGMFTQYSGTLPDDVLELVGINEEAIEGKVYLKTPVDVSGKSMQYEASFKASVLRKIKREPPTETDMKTAAGSQQAAAFKEFESAIRSSDLEKTKNLVSSDIADMLSTERGEEMVDRMKEMLPTEIKFLRVTVNGDTAVLEIQGMEGGEPVSGIVDLLDEGGAWKFRKIKVKNIN
jgi:hypothetical protein